LIFALLFQARTASADDFDALKKTGSEQRFLFQELVPLDFVPEAVRALGY
jgi:hypothetical protein